MRIWSFQENEKRLKRNDNIKKPKLPYHLHRLPSSAINVPVCRFWARISLISHKRSFHPSWTSCYLTLGNEVLPTTTTTTTGRPKGRYWLPSLGLRNSVPQDGDHRRNPSSISNYDILYAGFATLWKSRQLLGCSLENFINCKRSHVLNDLWLVRQSFRVVACHTLLLGVADLYGEISQQSICINKYILLSTD